MATPRDPAAHAPEPAPPPSTHLLTPSPTRTWSLSWTSSIFLTLALLLVALGFGAWFFRAWPFGLQQPHNMNESLIIEPEALATAERSLSPRDLERRDTGSRAAGASAEDRAGPVARVAVSREELELLARRIDALAARIENLPGRDPTASLNVEREVTGEVDRLSGRLLAQNRRVDELARRLSRVERGADRDALDEPAGLGSTGATAAAPPVAGVSPFAPSERANPAALAAGDETARMPESDDPDVDRALDLYRQAQRLGVEGREARVAFDRARAAFDELRERRPEDAVAWYYSALTHGLTTGDWGGAADEYARRGVEYERVGRPPHSRINQALQDLTPETGRDWINSYRRRLVPGSGPTGEVAGDGADAGSDQGAAAEAGAPVAGAEGAGAGPPGD